MTAPITSKATAQTAGLLYLVVAVTGGFSMLYVPSLIVPGNVAGTAGNLATHEFLFRLGIVSGLVCQVAFVFLALALYRLFRGVNQLQAALMVALVVAAAPVAFMNMQNQLAALRFLEGADYMHVFGSDQSQALMMMFLDQHAQGLLIMEIFWGLWLVPFGLLVIKSGFIPRFLGVLLIIGCVGYCSDFLTRLLFPQYTAFVSPVAAITKFGELAIILWLLIAGVKNQDAPAEARA